MILLPAVALVAAPLLQAGQLQPAPIPTQGLGPSGGLQPDVVTPPPQRAAWGPTLSEDFGTSNVLIILADDLGVDQLAVYGVGADPPPTPTLDQLAAQGVVFDNAWAYPYCSPTRAAIHTGRHAFRTGIGWLVEKGANYPTLSFEEVTLPELLDQGTNGAWDHALIGKWHLSNAFDGGILNPNLHGWRHYSGTVWNFSAAGPQYDYYFWPKVVNGVESLSTTYATTDQVDDTLAWIETASEPWLCYLSLCAPHDPLSAPPPELISYDLEGMSAHEDLQLFYKAVVEAMDTELGRLLATIDPEVLARTTVFFLGDNGSPSHAIVPPFDSTKGKGTLFQGGVRVPMIATGPLVRVPGRTAPQAVHVLDLFSTVAEIAGVDPQQVLPPGTALDSVSLVPILQDAAPPAVHTSLYAQVVYPPGLGLDPYQAHALTDGRYKLITHSFWPANRFFDLLEDPLETVDLLQAGFPSHQASVTYGALQAELSLLLP